MAVIDKLTVGIELKIDRRTAETCLHIVEMYVNQNPEVIIQYSKREDGYTEYEFIG